MDKQQSVPATAVPTLPVIVTQASNMLLPGNARQIMVTDAQALAALAALPRVDKPLLALAYQEEGARPHHACIVSVVQAKQLSEGGCMVIFIGENRCRLLELREDGRNEYLLAECVALADAEAQLDLNKAAGYRRAIDKQIHQLLRDDIAGISENALRNAVGITDLSAFVDFVVLTTTRHDQAAASVLVNILCETSVIKRIDMLFEYMMRRRERSRIDHQISKRVRKQMEKTHHEFQLSEQAKAIQEELDRGAPDAPSDGQGELEQRIRKANLPPAVEEKVLFEHRKLLMSQPMSPETAVLRTYLDTLLDLPWHARSELNTDINAAKETLDKDHYGLTKVKDRIMEYLAVQRRVGKPKGSVMCFVGPPGVGKTSLGQSIARATGRKFVRVSLGGVHEEAAIRGHRKTYVASMPGRIIKAMAKVEVRNPVFMLDEFDKLVGGAGMHGDPAAALLEVLDPEQNSHFTDQYLEVEFDLSEVMFITTANTVAHLPDALHDRLEIIELPGYTDQEKLTIAKRHLLPKQLAEHGMEAGQVRFGEKILLDIVRDYTLEAGVRELERSIAKVCRKIVTERMLDKNVPTSPVNVTRARVQELLEVPEYYSTFHMPKHDAVGYANGMIYGYGAFRMEAVVHDAKEDDIHVTGITTGDKEVKALISVAISLLQSRHAALGLSYDFAKNKCVHIHLQDQAVKPFGSLGLGLFTLVASVFCGTPIKAGSALLGEINLRGGVISSEQYSEYKTTVMDARRKKIGRIIMPSEDARLLEDLPAELTREMEFVQVRTVWDALRHVLTSQPQRVVVTGKSKTNPQPEILAPQVHRKKMQSPSAGKQQ